MLLSFCFYNLSVACLSLNLIEAFYVKEEEQRIKAEAFCGMIFKQVRYFIYFHIVAIYSL